MDRRHLALMAVIAAMGIALVGCGDDSATSAPASSETAEAGAKAISGELTVFAAASLTEGFTALGAAFETAHPGTKVTLNFGASSALVQQITGGAPADVFASADESSMKRLTDASLGAGDPAPFATNRLEILVGTGNPKGIKGLPDLAGPGLAVVLCAEQVPCGKYAKQILTAANISVTPRSLEENVKGVVTKVTLGEADAGIVYVTDVLAAEDGGEGVRIPDAQNALAVYPIIVTKASANPDAAAAFAEYVASAAGLAVLRTFGFGAP